MNADDLREIIRKGATFRMGFAEGGRVWWSEHPFIEVDDAVMQVACVGHNGQPLLVEAGDSLFGWPGWSQTWRSTFEE